jgi:predicted alpha/beta hydrolase family esterase
VRYIKQESGAKDMGAESQDVRVLIVPGLRNSGPAHWQSWLQAQFADAVRVEQRDWNEPQLDRWASRIGSTLERKGGERWIAVCHSFGCLALARHLALQPDSPIQAALLVAPAEPDKFGVAELLPQQALAVPTMLVASKTAPWMSAASARRWARRWGASYLNLGDAGHINTEAGFGPLPLAQQWVQSATDRLARVRRVERAAATGWALAI